MKIIDTYPEIISLIDKMSGNFDLGLWEEYAERISRDLAEKCKHDSNAYDFYKDIMPVLNAAINSHEKLEVAHNSFVKATYGLGEKIEAAVGIELHVDVLFYIGLCNGAGWATNLGGKPAVLLGVEKIMELGWYDFKAMAALIHHELGHIWHYAAGDISEEAIETPMMQLYSEGIAMYFEQLILGDFNYYHQDKDGWQKWCNGNIDALNTEYLRRLDAGESVQDFYGDWCSYQGHSDIGYFLGCEFVKNLAKKYTLDELAKLDEEVVYKEFKGYARLSE